MKKLSSPRSNPRFYWLSTNWNHGPHGMGSVAETSPGPYDAAAADSKPLADYINRLNDTVSAVKKLQQFVAQSPFPIALLLYGDHHPAFKKNYSAQVRGKYPDADYLTPIMMFRNFEGPSVPAKEIIGVEEVAYYLSEFTGIAPFASTERIHQLQQGCGGDQMDCSDAEKSALRAVQLP